MSVLLALVATRRERCTKWSKQPGKGTVVKSLSEQLSELAARVKTAEDILGRRVKRTEQRWKANESS
jgi:hypothetical protein